MSTELKIVDDDESPEPPPNPAPDPDPTPIPTLPEPAAWVLAVLLLGSGAVRLRRRPTRPRA